MEVSEAENSLQNPILDVTLIFTVLSIFTVVCIFAIL